MRVNDVSIWSVVTCSLSVLLVFSFLPSLPQHPPLMASVSSGLRVIIHPFEDFRGSVCVNSATEDLGCKRATGPGNIEFRFSPDAVSEGQEFNVCVGASSCVTGVNSPARAPENIYLLAKGRTTVPSTQAATASATSEQVPSQEPSATADQQTVNRLLTKCQLELPGTSKETRCSRMGSEALCIAFGASIGVARELCDNLPPIA
jgi:hypothetical protein